MNRVCARLPAFSSFISYGGHQHWRMLQHGNIRQCSLSLCPWVLHCGCPELHSVEGSPQISFVTCRHVTNKLTKPNQNANVSKSMSECNNKKKIVKFTFLDWSKWQQIFTKRIHNFTIPCLAIIYVDAEDKCSYCEDCSCGKIGG